MQPLKGLTVVTLEHAIAAPGMSVESRAHRLEAKARDLVQRRMTAQQVHQQRRDQRPVDDQARIALDLGHVAPVVVDAVAVEGQRRIAEQHVMLKINKLT